MLICCWVQELMHCDLRRALNDPSSAGRLHWPAQCAPPLPASCFACLALLLCRLTVQLA